MSTRRILHQLVDELPEENLYVAERALQALLASAPAPHVPLDEAPLDTGPDDDDFDGGLAEARADADARRVVPHEEARLRVLGWERHATSSTQTSSKSPRAPRRAL